MNSKRASSLHSAAPSQLLRLPIEVLALSFTLPSQKELGQISSVCKFVHHAVISAWHERKSLEIHSSSDLKKNCHLILRRYCPSLSFLTVHSLIFPREQCSSFSFMLSSSSCFVPFTFECRSTSQESSS